MEDGPGVGTGGSNSKGVGSPVTISYSRIEQRTIPMVKIIEDTFDDERFVPMAS